MPRGVFQRKQRDVNERFDKKWVRASNGCHLWTAATTKGYGAFALTHSKQVSAHKFAYERKYGPVPPGLVLDHVVCETPRCCNPDHVTPTTNPANVMRGRGPCAMNARKSHCKRGHEFTEANTYVFPHGGRQCRTCYRMHDKARHARGRVR